ncbi:MAG: methyl-accepting chemotaxis protein [Lachnospiraceae bacterium]|nr:methyl-accepting chemotaxis protein [Lachnospiraceae bacterium]
MKALTSIKGKLILALVSLVVVPVLVLSIISMVISLNQGKANADEINNAQAQLVSQQLETIYEANFEALKAFAASSETINYLEGKETGADVEEDLLRQMTLIDESMNDGNSTALSDATGQQMVRTIGKLVNVAERDYFKQPMAGAPHYVSDLIVSKSTGTAIATFSVPVYNMDKTATIGIVQRNYNVGDLHELVAGDVTQDKQEIVIVDRTGTVVAHSGREVNTEDPEKQDQNPFYTESRGSTAEGHYVAPFAGDTWIISWEKLASSEWVVASCRVQEVALATVYHTVMIQGIFGVLFIIAGIIIAWIFANSITNPLSEVGNTLSNLAEGKFRKVEGYDRRSDEFGVIIKDTNDVVEKLKGIVGQISNGAGDVDNASDELANTSSRISSNTESVSHAVQEIATGATQQAEEIQNATRNIERIEEAVESVQTSAQELSNIADRMQVASSDSANSLSELKESSENMNQAINGISEKISATSDAVGRINGMVEAISSIASQTNLLSLNASIEAARAGEAGRGFAVVAEEIGKLALDSNDSANKIRSEMDALLSESQAAVKMADNVQKNNEKQQEVIESTFVSVNKMIEDIAVTTEKVEKISQDADACVSAQAVVADAMSSLSAISEENAASSQETGASMAELTETVSSLSDSARSLRNVSSSLSDEIGFFK